MASFGIDEFKSEINKRGGLAYIEQSTHNVGGYDKFWESTGQNNTERPDLQAQKLVFHGR